MKRVILLSLLQSVFFIAFAQIETSVWYFGDYAGVDFKSGSPVALTDGALATREGCASICDKNGDILFYTEGTTVWNKNHQIMENGTGLLGDFSSTQSAIIVPRPNSDNLYYIITVPSVYNSGNAKLRYSIVDISLNDGIGKVTVKNKFIYDQVEEKVTAVKKSNEIDYWVITHERYSNKFLAFSLTSDGLDIDNPTESNVGTVHVGPVSNFVGYLKVSPLGNYLALALHGSLELFELFKFDNTTGVISDPIVIKGYKGAYGVEFSPDESRLYLGRIRNQAEIFQINLELENPEDIINSLTSVGVSPSHELGAMQIGPDKKIYVSLDFSNYLGVINEPNLLGDECDFVLNGVYLKGRQARLGLPNFVTSYFALDFTYDPDCYGDSTWFNIQYSGSIDSVHWDFGDPVTGEDNFSNLENPFHIFSSPGAFLVQVIIYTGGSEYSIEKNVVIFPTPVVELGNDTSLCSQNMLLLNAGSGFDSYLWQDGSTDSVYFADTSGIYWVQVTNICGTSSDTIRVTFGDSFDIDLGSDTSFCYGQTVLLSPGGGYYSYYWQDGSTDSVLLAGNTGYYWVQVTDSAGCTATDSVYIEAYMEFSFSLGPDTSRICEGDYLILHGPGGYASYTWQDGSGYPDLIADTSGIYWLEVTAENGCAARDSMLLIVNRIPVNFLGNDTVLCEGGSFSIHAPPVYDKYIWQDGSSDSVFIARQAGDYWVYVEDSIGCSGVDTISLSLFEPPQLSRSGDTLVCPGDSLRLTPGEGMLYYKWNTGSTDSAITVTEEGDYWVEMGTNCGTFTDSILVDLYSDPDFSPGPDTNICGDETIRLSAGPGFRSYLWGDGSTDSVLTVHEPGIYPVVIDDGRCLLSGSVKVDKCNLLWIPNVFTPNNDGYNDYFYAVGENVIKFEMVIYNRWGVKMATLNNIEQKWDGRYNGVLCTDGVYYYEAVYEEVGRDAFPVKRQVHGSVTLISGR